MRRRWCELDGVTLLTDPLLRRRVAHLRRLHPVAPVPSVDAVLLSHLHADHLDFRSLALLPHQVPLVLPAGAGASVRRRTRREVVELAVGEETRVGAVAIRAVRADHASGRHPLSRRVEPLGFVIAGSQTVYFAGDTDLFPEMAALAPLDAALVPVWGWGPTLPAGHLDPDRAAEAVRLLRPRVAIPIHWGTYSVIGSRGSGAEPAERFQREAARIAPTSTCACCSPERQRKSEVGAAFLWGFLAASSLVVGGIIALRFRIGLRALGLVMGFGSGVLISAVAYELVDEAFSTADAGTAVAIGLFAGCGTSSSATR